MNEVYKVYALCGPDMRPRYVGLTMQSLIARTKGHLAEAKGGKTPKDRWLQDVGEDLIVRELERFQWNPGDERPGQKEQRWIDRFRKEGCALFNRERRAKRLPFTVIEIDEKDKADGLV